VKLRLDPEVLTSFRATGRGWQTLMNAVLVAAAFRLQKSGARFAFGGLDPSDPDLANAASCSAESHDESTESEKESSAPTRSPPSTRAIADAAVSKSTSV
jgi:hypothetical protein